MKKLVFVICLFVSASSNGQVAVTGHDIMTRQYSQNKGWHDEKGVGKMIIKDTATSETVREFEYNQLEAGGGSGSSSLIRITKPANLKDTGLLTHQNPGRDDDQWVYLPALKKTNRIVGGARKGRFIGSDFSYEDLAPKNLDDYAYTLLRDELCGDITCHVIDGMRQSKQSSYSKITLWVRSDNLQNTKMELYDDDGSLIKRVLFEDIRQLNATYWRPHRITMENLAKNSSSVFQIDSLVLSSGLTMANFTKGILER